jgi:hypothetical protein
MRTSLSGKEATGVPDRLFRVERFAFTARLTAPLAVRCRMMGEELGRGRPHESSIYIGGAPARIVT